MDQITEYAGAPEQRYVISIMTRIHPVEGTAENEPRKRDDLQGISRFLHDLRILVQLLYPCQAGLGSGTPV